MKNIALNDLQKEIVSGHLHLVPQVIKSKIKKNESIYGLGYEDLMQEGYLLLCHAACSYDPKFGIFEPYAKKVIYNGLISHCRKVYQYESRFTSLITDENGYPLPCLNDRTETDTFAQRVEMVEMIDLLSFYAQQYRGITRKGIEALLLKLQGKRISEIASAFQIPPSHVGAWISRAKSVLRSNTEFKQTIL